MSTERFGGLRAQAWARYLADGTIDGLEEALAERDAEESGEAKVPGPFDGLLGDGGDGGGEGAEDVSAAWDDEDDEPYDPLPGFEHFT